MSATLTYARTEILPVPAFFSLEKTLDCGQVFRFRRIENTVFTCQINSLKQIFVKYLLKISQNSIILLEKKQTFEVNLFIVKL